MTTVTDLAELVAMLALPEDVVALGQTATDRYRLAIPSSLLGRIEKGNLADPIVRQFLPVAEELLCDERFVADPLEEGKLESSGVLIKYAGRALLRTTNRCGCACRYCFRRERRNLVPFDFSGETSNESVDSPAVRELIFSGGDPFTLDNASIKQLHDYSIKLPHVNRVRFHTRLPILDPARVDAPLQLLLRSWANSDRMTRNGLLPPQTVFVIFQVNHSAEIDDSVRAMFREMSQTGVIMMAQSVLLRGVNDDSLVLATLWESLVDCRVIPYYLHQLDRVCGATHFEVSPERGKQLVTQAAERVPGYAVPRFVRETPGAPCKQDVFAR